MNTQRETVTQEEWVTCAEASRRLPPVDGRPIASETILRWARTGVRGVRLESRQLGRRVVTSMAAIERFFERLGRTAAGRTPGHDEGTESVLRRAKLL